MRTTDIKSKGPGSDHTARKVTPVDAVIGRNIKQRRNELKLSQEELAEMLGISFQQLGKYEDGQNRVAASRLMQLAAVMGVEVASFFPSQSDLSSDVVREREISLRSKLLEHFDEAPSIEAKSQLVQIAAVLASKGRSKA